MVGLADIRPPSAGSENLVPRQQERFEAIAAEWIDLPAGSFKKQGTSVNAAIVVIDG